MRSSSMPSGFVQQSKYLLPGPFIAMYNHPLVKDVHMFGYLRGWAIAVLILCTAEMMGGVDCRDI
jgi:hypothetical protein